MTGTLHNRRPHFIDGPIEWAGVIWLVGVGFDTRGKAVEVFADLADTQAIVEPAIVTLVHEASITCSHLLQAGADAARHAERLMPSRPGDAGLLYLMCRRAGEVERQEGDNVRWLEALLAERRTSLAAETNKAGTPIEREGEP